MIGTFLGLYTSLQALVFQTGDNRTEHIQHVVVGRGFWSEWAGVIGVVPVGLQPSDLIPRDSKRTVLKPYADDDRARYNKTSQTILTAHSHLVQVSRRNNSYIEFFTRTTTKVAASKTVFKSVNPAVNNLALQECGNRSGVFEKDFYKEALKIVYTGSKYARLENHVGPHSLSLFAQGNPVQLKRLIVGLGTSASGKPSPSSVENGREQTDQTNEVEDRLPDTELDRVFSGQGATDIRRSALTACLVAAMAALIGGLLGHATFKADARHVSKAKASNKDERHNSNGDA